jgi:transposase
VTNTTVVNTETRCELLQWIASPSLKERVTVVLDNARHPRNTVVQALARSRGIELLDLPWYSPNLNPIERRGVGLNKKRRFENRPKSLICNQLATERKGFEPLYTFRHNSISSAASSTTRAPLRIEQSIPQRGIVNWTRKRIRRFGCRSRCGRLA